MKNIKANLTRQKIDDFLSKEKIVQMYFNKNTIIGVSVPVSQSFFNLLYDIKGTVVFFKNKIVNSININILQDLTNEFGKTVVRYKTNDINQIIGYFDNVSYRVSKYYGVIKIDAVDYIYEWKDTISGKIYTDDELNTWFVVPNEKFIVSSTLDEVLDEKLGKDMNDEDVVRLLDKIKKKNLNINVLKLAFPEIVQKSDLLKKMQSGPPNIV